MEHPVISFENVTKVFHTGLFRKKTAVDDVSFTVQSGEVVGMLGANGSGKSTSLKMMLGFLRPTRGEIRVCGQSPRDPKTRRWIGYLPENPRFQKFLTAKQFLAYCGSLTDVTGQALMTRIDYLLDLVGLVRSGHDLISGFSKGMCQRLAIAQALLHEPRVLVFDEPMSGLDPIGRREIRHLIGGIKKQMAITMVFSSHILSDVEELCQSVLLLRHGRLTRHCSISVLLERDPDEYRLVVPSIPPLLAERFHSKLELTREHATLSITGTDDLQQVLAELKRAGISVVSLTSQRRSLEDSLFTSEERKQADLI